MRRWLGRLLLLLVATGVRAQKGQRDTPEANPARPTVTTPATLPPTGYLQFETGVLIGADSPHVDRQVSLNQVTKAAVTKRLEVFVNSEPWASTECGARLPLR